MASRQIYPVHASGAFETHRAGWVITDADTLIENGYISVENGKIKGVYQGTPSPPFTDHGPGVLMPPLVNSHLHLELSALKNKVPFNKGFQVWVQSLLEKRSVLTQDELIRAGREQARNLNQQGHLYIGDISTLGIGRAILKGSGIRGVSFTEYLGTEISKWHTRKNKDLSISLAGHAPHTSSPQLLQSLKKKTDTAHLPFSIHLAESEAEHRFIHRPGGVWADFLASRGIDWSSWPLGNKTPVAYLNDLNLLGPSTLSVHLLNTTNKDLQMISQTKTKVCLCPRSNYNLHGKLPDIQTMLALNIEPAIGTDSLASCSSLNILDEIPFIRIHFPQITTKTLFRMATEYGAKALGMDTVTGTLTKGKNADFIYRDIQTTNKKKLIHQVLFNE